MKMGQPCINIFIQVLYIVFYGMCEKLTKEIPVKEVLILKTDPKSFTSNCNSSLIAIYSKKPVYKNQNFKNHQPEISRLILSKTVFVKQIIPIKN